MAPASSASRAARILAGTLIVFVFIAIIASFTPLRTVLGAWLGFNRAPGETVIQTPVAVTVLPVDTQAAAATLPAASTPASTPRSVDPKIERVSRDAGWAILQPAWLPEGYTFSEILFDDKNKMVTLSYLAQRRLPGSDGLTETKQITLTQAQAGDQIPLQAAPSASLVEIQLGSKTGAYALGGWKSEFIADQNEANGGHFQATWDGALNVQNLFWQAGGVYLVLISDDPQVSKDDLVKMASSVSP